MPATRGFFGKKRDNRIGLRFYAGPDAFAKRKYNRLASNTNPTTKFTDYIVLPFLSKVNNYDPPQKLLSVKEVFFLLFLVADDERFFVAGAVKELVGELDSVAEIFSSLLSGA